MTTLEDIERKYNLSYDDIIKLLYDIGTLTEVNVENIIKKLDEIESIDS